MYFLIFKFSVVCQYVWYTDRETSVGYGIFSNGFEGLGRISENLLQHKTQESI